MAADKRAARLGVLALVGMLLFGLVGFWDDYLKLVAKNHHGLVPRWKYFWQSVVAIAVATLLYQSALVPAETRLIVPFFKGVAIELGLLYIAFSYFVIVGTSNAVNLTDGLDGLAILPIIAALQCVCLGSALPLPRAWHRPQSRHRS